MKREIPSAERLRTIFHYDPATGAFFRLTSRFVSRFSIKEAGTIDHKGYRQIKIGDMKFAAHRLAFLYMTGSWPINEVDHKNRQRDDNRWANLRLASRTENARNLLNSRPRKMGSLKGTCFDPRWGWRAAITVNGRMLHLGYFASEADAHETYKTAAIHHFGEFARMS